MKQRIEMVAKMTLLMQAVIMASYVSAIPKDQGLSGRLQSWRRAVRHTLFFHGRLL